MNKKLTLIFITHNKLKETTEYINSIIGNIPKAIDVFLIYDNKEVINDELSKRVKFLSWENKGKMFSILKASNEVKTNYFKVIDHDDCIDYRFLKDLLEKIPNNNNNFLYHTANIIYDTSNSFGKITSKPKELDILRKDSQDVFWNKIPNAQALYNTDVISGIYKKHKNLIKQTFFNDDFLTIACQLHKGKTKKINVGFYYQFHNKGQNSSYKKQKVYDHENLYLNLKNISINEQLHLSKNRYRRILRSINFQNRNFENEDPGNKIMSKKILTAFKEFKYLNKLTLLITMHSQFESIDFFIKLLENCDNEVIFAFDNPKIPKKWIDLIKSKGMKYFINEENTGKLNLVFNVSHLINTEYFKIIDQDDSISVPHLRKFNKKINKVSGPVLIKHKAFKVKESNPLFIQTIDEKIIKKQVSESEDVFYNQQTNCDTIYHTETIKSIREGKMNLSRQDFHNDVLLSNFLIGLGLELKIINKGFYIQFHEMGQTSKLNIKRSECILELYKNYKYLQDNIKEFNITRLMNSEKRNHIRFINRFTNTYLEFTDKNLGKELYENTIEILEDLWRA